MILVTGGSGFVGHALVRALVERGEQVRSFSRGNYPEIGLDGVEQVRGDVADARAVSRAVAGCALVFHTAALTATSGKRSEFDATNIEGTRNVISACKEHGVPHLVYTSSPSVVFDGRDIEGGDEESLPYPLRHTADYPRTKAEAERLVRAADDETLVTVCLRPHLVWGPGDTQLGPRLIERARRGRLRKFSGPSKAIDPTYIDDVVAAHLAAADRLREGSRAIRGRAYFVTSGDPIPVWDMIDALLAADGLPPIDSEVSPRTALLVGTIFDLVWSILPLRGEAPITRWVAKKLSVAQWFCIDAARRDLGWEPRVPREVGLERFARSLKKSE